MPLMTWPFHPSLVSIAVESRNLLPFQTERYRALHSRLNLIDGGLDLLKIGSFCNFIFDGVLASPNWFIGELLLPYYPQVAQDSVIAKHKQPQHSWNWKWMDETSRNWGTDQCGRCIGNQALVYDRRLKRVRTETIDYNLVTNASTL